MGYIVDKTPLIAIKYDLLRKQRVGDVPIVLIGLDVVTNGYIDLLTVYFGWLPDEKKDPNTGQMLRRYNVLLLDPVDANICEKTAAIGVGDYFYSKKSQVPYDGVANPREWVFSCAYLGSERGLNP